MRRLLTTYARLFCTEIDPKLQVNIKINSILRKAKSFKELNAIYQSQKTQFGNSNKATLLKQLLANKSKTPQSIALMRSLVSQLYENLPNIGNLTLTRFLIECYNQRGDQRIDFRDIVKPQPFLHEIEERLKRNLFKPQYMRQLLLGVERLPLNDRTRILTEVLLQELLQKKDNTFLTIDQIIQLTKLCRRKGYTKYCDILCKKLSQPDKLSIHNIHQLLKLAATESDPILINREQLIKVALPKLEASQHEYSVPFLTFIIWNLGKFNIGDMTLFNNAVDMLKRKLNIQQHHPQISEQNSEEVELKEGLIKNLSPQSCVQLLAAFGYKKHIDVQLFEVVETTFTAQLSFVDVDLMLIYIRAHTELCLTAIRMFRVDNSLKSRLRVQKIKNYHYSVFSKIFTFISASKQYTWIHLIKIIKYSNKLEIKNRPTKRLQTEMIFTKVQEGQPFKPQQSKYLEKLDEIVSQYLSEADKEKLRSMIKVEQQQQI